MTLNPALVNAQVSLLVCDSDGGGQAHGTASVGRHRVPAAGSLATSGALVAFIVTLGDVSWSQHLQFFFFQVYVIYFTFKFD